MAPNVAPNVFLTDNSLFDEAPPLTPLLSPLSSLVSLLSPLCSLSSFFSPLPLSPLSPLYSLLAPLLPLSRISLLFNKPHKPQDCRSLTGTAELFIVSLEGMLHSLQFAGAGSLSETLIFCVTFFACASSSLRSPYPSHPFSACLGMLLVLHYSVPLPRFSFIFVRCFRSPPAVGGQVKDCLT